MSDNITSDDAPAQALTEDEQHLLHYCATVCTRATGEDPTRMPKYVPVDLFSLPMSPELVAEYIHRTDPTFQGCGDFNGYHWNPIFKLYEDADLPVPASWECERDWHGSISIVKGEEELLENLRIPDEQVVEVDVGLALDVFSSTPNTGLMDWKTLQFHGRACMQSKWAKVEEVEEELRILAKTFPGLYMRAQVNGFDKGREMGYKSRPQRTGVVLDMRLGNGAVDVGPLPCCPMFNRREHKAHAQRREFGYDTQMQLRAHKRPLVGGNWPDWEKRNIKDGYSFRRWQSNMLSRCHELRKDVYDALVKRVRENYENKNR